MVFPFFIKMFCVINSISIRINSNLEFIQIKSPNEKGTLVVNRILGVILLWGKYVCASWHNLNQICRKYVKAD